MADEVNIAASVANGGSPQPVIKQAPTLTVNDADRVAEEVTGNKGQTEDDDNGEGLDMTETGIAAAEKAGDISKKEAQALKKKLKIKVDGQEFEEELNWDDEEGLKRHIQKSKAFDSRSKTFSDYEKNVKTFFEKLKEQPEDILEQMGINLDDMSEKRLQRKVDEMKKSPEQLATEKMQKELEELRKKLSDEEKSKKDREMETARNQQAQAIEKEINEALDNVKTKLPKNNPKVVEMIGQAMYFAMKNGYKDVSAKDVVPIVERQWKQEQRAFFDSSTEDLIEEFVGQENLARWRKKYLSKIRSENKTETAKQAVQDTGTIKKKEIEKPKKSFKSLFSYHDE